MKLPALVSVCPACEGKGQTKQTYTAGCGMGYYSALGPCYICSRPGLDTWEGPGYVYKGTCTGVPLSVEAQIRVMNQ